MDKILNFLKNKILKIIKAPFLLLIIILISYGIVYAFLIDTKDTGWRATTITKTIDVYGKCKKVTKVSGQDVFVPTKTEAE